MRNIFEIDKLQCTGQRVVGFDRISKDHLFINGIIIVRKLVPLCRIMTQTKIQPWNHDLDEQLGYAQKLQILSNFSSSTNINKKPKRKNTIHLDAIQKINKNNHAFSAQTTQLNFNKTNRSQYRHRVTKLVFAEEGNKKYKFEPDSEIGRKRNRLFSSHKILKSIRDFHEPIDKVLERSKQDGKKNKKQIYYNLTQMSSPMNHLVKQKCNTQESDQQKQSFKFSILDRIKRQKKVENSPISRELSVERKIYILQTGSRSPKQTIKQEFTIKKHLKKSRNIIQQICMAQRQISRQINKDKS